MSVEILTDTTRRRECLMCNTTDTVFGPVMELGEAEEFIEHLAEIEIADARHVARRILVDLYENWKTTRDERQRQEDGPSDDGGYPKDDPKHPTYHSRMSDIWDLRDRG